MSSPRCLLTIIAAPALEETIIDWLLTQEAISGFSSSEIYGHGSRSNQLSLLEQVTGRQKRIQFSVHTELETAHSLIIELKHRHYDAGLHYLIAPVIETGQI